MNRVTLKSLLLTSFLAGALSLQAQELPKVFGRPAKSVNPKNGVIRCATSEYEEYLQERNPERQKRDEFEAWLAPKVAQVKADRLAGRSVSAIITIPVVVHVIHNGDAVGVNENLAEAQVMAQIEVLNQDFRRRAGTPGYNTNPVGADVEIEFCMAQTDPNGKLTNGIDRVRLSAASYSSPETIDANVKPRTIWDATKYFNIWTVNIGDDTDLLGYAQFPNNTGVAGVGNNNGDANTDGLVIGARYFGSKDIYPNGYYSTDNPEYSYGRTATHEIGHCLGLLHISGDNFRNCTVNATDSFKDYCPDTPATKQYNYSCNGNRTIDSCPDAPGLDMLENYMDYTDDQCMSVFTQNQKDRMIAVMKNGTRRKSLLTSTVCQAPSAGNEEFNMLNHINLYPNPVNDVLNINVASNDLPDSFTVYNSLGQSVAFVKVRSTAHLTVNTSGFSTGIYFIKIDKGSQSKTLKFVKQ